MTLRFSKFTTVCGGAIGLLAIPILSQSVEAQERSLTIQGAPSCSTCTIELTHVATAGRPNDPFRFFSYSELHRGPHNTIIAINSIPGRREDVPAVLHLDSAGRFLKQIVKPGSRGPFQMASAGDSGNWSFMVGIGRGDSVYLRDRGGGHYVFGPSLESGRTISHTALPRIPMTFQLALPNGSFVGSAQEPVKLAAPLGLLSETGLLIKRVGQLTPEELLNQGFSSRSVSLGKDRTHFWVMRRNQYDLQRFTIEGERDLTLNVAGSPWMRRWIEEPRGTYTSLEDVKDAGGGRLWVMAQVPVLGASLRDDIGTASWPTRLELQVSTLIEMINVERGSVIASRRFEREVYYFLDSEHVARQKEDTTGFVTWDIYRIALRER